MLVVTVADAVASIHARGIEADMEAQAMLQAMRYFSFSAGGLSMCTDLHCRWAEYVQTGYRRVQECRRCRYSNSMLS